MQHRQLLLAATFILLFATGFPHFQFGVTYATPIVGPADEHHVAELNSNMPYIAGFQVNADDLSQRETVNATAVTVNFVSAEPEDFPGESWLGGGMFVQAQDSFYHNVDYGFYMMLVLDTSGSLFIDAGLHQTEEETAPIQTARSSLVYSYTWKAENVGISTPVKLTQTWLNSSSVRYSISASGFDKTLSDVDVSAMPNCGNIIPRFYTGNVVMDQFPFSRYINYFQFGVASNRTIPDTHWQITIQNPMMLRNSSWTIVDKAWLLEGDHSYLDFGLMWGGAPYQGIGVTPYVLQSQNLYEVSFKYTGNESPSNMTLWNAPFGGNPGASYAIENQDLTVASRRELPVIVTLLGAGMLIPFLLVRRKANRNARRQFAVDGAAIKHRGLKNVRYEE